jgi:hypothetical protein
MQFILCGFFYALSKILWIFIWYFQKKKKLFLLYRIKRKTNSMLVTNKNLMKIIFYCCAVQLVEN